MTGTQLAKIAFAVLLLTTGLAMAKDESHSVAGPTAKGGTSVAPHGATNPNGSKRDKGSTKGNVDSRTDAEGTKDPYAVPLLQQARSLR